MGRKGRTLRAGLVRLFLVPCGLALGSTSNAGPSPAPPLFDSPHFPIPIPTADFVIADVNGDGKDDVVGVLPADGTVGVYLNRGRRNFTPLSPIAVGDTPEHLVSVELDGDGRPDLVVSGIFGVKTLLGDGSGGFRAGTTLVEGPAHFGAGDLTSDGLTDVVVQQEWQSRVFVALPGGGFLAPAELSSGEGIPLLADFDGDGAVDVAVVRTGNWSEQRVILYPGDGVGAFGAPKTTFFSRSGNVSDAVVCHSTPDASPDIAIRFNSYIDDVGVLESQSDGSFVHPGSAECLVGEAPRQVLPWRGPGSESAGPRLEPQHHPKGITCIGSADVDRDGRLELLSTYVYTRASVYTRITFSDGRCVRVDQTASDRVAVGDLDVDGHLDVIGGEAAGLVVHAGDGVARYGRGVRSEITHWSKDGVLADFNGDGILDLASTLIGNNVAVSLGRPGGAFDPPNGDFEQYIPTNGRFVAADLTGDGRADLVTDRGGIWFGNEDGTFQEAGAIPEEASYLAVADLNDDGHPDLVLSGAASSAYLGNGDGTFAPSWSTATDPGPCTIADADGDGRPDLFVGGSYARGRGDGTFEAPTPTGAGSVAAVEDLSGDRIPDLITVEGQILRGDGSGSWSTWTSITAAQWGFRGRPPLALGDFDGDGHLDIAAADPTFSASIAIFLNDTRGGFTPGGSYGAGIWGNYLQNLVPMDVTGDGKLDLMAIYSGDPHGLPGAVTTLVNIYNRPPDISAAAARLERPASHAPDFAPVLLSGVVDPEGDDFTVEVVGVEQDEPVLGSGSGHTCPDAIVHRGRAAVRLERSGQGDGRIYEIRFVARDAVGNESEGQVQVCVPHDHSRGEPCIHDGRRYSSLLCRGGWAETDDERIPPTAELRVLSSAAAGVRFGVTMPGQGTGDVTVFDIAGRRLAKLEFACEGPCERDVVWDRGGNAPGVYFARMRTAWGVQARTVVLTNR